MATRIGVQGMGGIGKSVLAAAVVREDEVRAAFSGGIFWLALGQVPDLLTRQASLYWLLARKRGSFADAQQGRAALQQALRGRACLVVLDDVWRLADAEAFNVVDTGARLLLTTRDGAIVRAIGAREHEVGRLDRPHSLRLLAETARVAEADLPEEADAIAHECGDLPLALALAGGMIGGQPDMWRPVLEALQQADLEQIEGEFPGYPYPHVFAAIEASAAALGPDKERYLDLAIFPEDVPIPPTALAALWSGTGGGALQNRARINRFRDRSLARVAADGNLGLHDLQRDFVRKRASDLPGRHRRLVEAWRKECRGGWASGPTDEYFFRHLPLHLDQAGLVEELRGLLLDPRWISAKLAATDVAPLLSDYTQATDPEVVLVGRALMLSANVIVRDPAQLAGQLTGRLHGAGGAGVAGLLAATASVQRSSWLRPRTRSLTPPGPELRRFEGHKGGVWSVAVLADGHRALSGSDDRTLRLWDLDTGTELRRFEGHEGRVTSVAALPDGRRALSGSDDRTLRLWDLETGAELRRFEGHKGVAVLADGRRATDVRTLGPWYLWTGADELRPFEVPVGLGGSVAVLRDGRRALSGYDCGMLSLWDLATGAVLRRFEGQDPEDRASALVAVLPDDRRALSGSQEGTTLRLWDLETGAELRRFEGHEGAVYSVAVLADGRRALSGSQEGTTLRLWDLETGAELRRFEGHEGAVYSVAVLADGRRALSGSDDRTLRLWELGPGVELRRLESHESRVSSIAPLADGRRALSGSDDRTLRLWDLATGAEVRRFEGHESAINSVAVLGRRALSGSDAGVMREFELEKTGDEFREREATCIPITLSGSFDQTLRLWDVESGAELRCFVGNPRGPRSVKSVAVLPDRRRALSGCDDGIVQLWDLDTGAELRRFEGPKDWVTSIAVLADGRRVLSGYTDGTLRLWDVESGAEIRRFEGQESPVTSLVAVTSVVALPDSRRALAGYWEEVDRDNGVRPWDRATGTERLWDLDTGTELRRFEGDEGGVWSVAVLADGRRALSGSDDRTLCLWDLETGAALAVFTGDAAITAVAVACDDLFVAGSANGAIHILELIDPNPA